MTYLRELYLMIRYKISRREAIERDWLISQGYNK